MTHFAGNTGVQSRGRSRVGAVVVVLCAVQFVDVLGVTVVTTALPRMLHDLDATDAQGAAVVNGYALFFGGLLMVAARLGDRLGHRRILVAALVLFAAASVLGALAPSVWALAGARALQGVSAAASVPSALRLLTTIVPEGTARRRAIAGWSAAGAAAGASGFVVGGVLTQAASWRAVFWMDIGLAALLGAAIVRLIPGDEPSQNTGRVGGLSACSLTAGAMGVVAGTTLFADARSVLLATGVTALGVVAAVAFVVVERRTRYPLVPPDARKSPRLRWGTFGSFFNTATTSASITVATLYLQDELGLAPMETGALLVTFSVLVVAGSALAPKLLGILGWGPALGFGLGTVAIGTAVLVAWPTVVGIGVAASVSGLGIGIGSVAATDLGTSVGEQLKGTASGVLNTAAQLGAAIGTGVTMLVATAYDAHVAWVFVAGYAALAAMASAAFAPRKLMAPTVGT